jgi:aerobic-type carbon monoxide dehydrogenase small subunit (CoxS/CutS family)
MATEDLLARDTAIERADVERLLAGQVCRCTGYEPIIDAILETAERRRAP